MNNEKLMFSPEGIIYVHYPAVMSVSALMQAPFM